MEAAVKLGADFQAQALFIFSSSTILSSLLEMLPPSKSKEAFFPSSAMDVFASSLLFKK